MGATKRFFVVPICYLLYFIKNKKYITMQFYINRYQDRVDMRLETYEEQEEILNEQHCL